MKNRIREIRDYFGLNQRTFADRIDVGQSTLAMFETGDRPVRDVYIKRICSEFCINEEWLRSGKGEMLIEKEDVSLMSKASVLLGERDPVFETFIETYSKLNSQNRAALLEFLEGFSEVLKSKKE